MEPRLATLPERTVAVVEHRGSPESVDRTRRPLYRHMVLNELVGGPSILRWLDRPGPGRVVDALVTTHAGFEGDDVCRVETLPAGRYALLDYEGPPEEVPDARDRLLDWLGERRLRPTGPLLQVHLMDPVEGILEAQLQVPLL
ncbi:MAG TPA: GyrI-like domain-containing protein [Candidatus Thermoplasmatota archaeon]|nr:GyrI-like domain-containing protein [Candidatus Thermoplasmatota archaeon]